jgi:hypothetical protein
MMAFTGLMMLAVAAQAAPSLLMKSQTLQRLQLESQVGIDYCYEPSKQQKCNGKLKCCRGYGQPKAKCLETCPKGAKVVDWQTGEPKVKHVSPYGTDFTFSHDGSQVTMRVGWALGAGGNAVVFQCCHRVGPASCGDVNEFKFACRTEFPPQPTSEMTPEFRTMEAIQAKVPEQYRAMFARPAYIIDNDENTPCYDVEEGFTPDPFLDKKNKGCSWGIMHMSGEKYNLEQCFLAPENLLTAVDLKMMVTEALKALYILHHSGYAHRDAQPKNLMTTNCKTPVAWVDIGGAHELERDSPEERQTQVTRDIRTLLGGNSDGDCPSCGGWDLTNYANQVSAKNPDKEKIVALAQQLDDAAQKGMGKTTEERKSLFEEVLGKSSLKM